MDNDYSDTAFDQEMSRQHEQNQREIQDKRQRLFETALEIQKFHGGQSWGENL